MPSFHLVEIVAEEPAATVSERLIREGAKNAANGLENYVKGLAGGNYNGILKVRAGAVPATGTFDLETVVATNTALINGVTFQAVASNPTGNEFEVGGDDTETAANLAATINASATALVNQHVRATSDGPQVQLTAKVPGASGNAITIAGGGATIAASGARLEDGSDGTLREYAHGLAE